MNLMERLKNKRETLKIIAIVIAGVAFLAWFLTSAPCH